MIGGPEQGPAWAERRARAMGKFGLGNVRLIDTGRGLAKNVPGETPQRKDTSRLGQEAQLALQVGHAPIAFFGRGAVVGRDATHGGGEVQIGVAEAIAPVGRSRLVCESGVEARPRQEARRSIAGKDAPGPVRTVRGRSKSHDDKTRLRVSKAGDGTSPIHVGTEFPFLLRGNPLAVTDETRTLAAMDDLVAEPRQGIRHAGRLQWVRLSVAGGYREHSPGVTYPFRRGVPTSER